MESKTLQAFEEAIKNSSEYINVDCPVVFQDEWDKVAKAVYNIHKAECIKFAEWYDNQVLYIDESGMPQQTISELFDLYQQEKDK